jgi:hypothetical protein
MSKHKCIAFAASALVAFTSVEAGANIVQLDRPQGKVLVNQGQGFRPASESLPLKAGDQVMVGANGAATLRYAEAQCSVTLSPSSVMTVSDEAPCTAGEDIAAASSTLIAPALGQAGPLPGNYGGAPYVPIVVGTSLLTTVLVSVHIATNQDGKPPVSAP